MTLRRPFHLQHSFMLACLTLFMSLVVPLALPSRAAVPCQVPLPVSDERARELLSEERPFALADPDLFFSYENPAWYDAAPLVRLDGPALTEAETADALRRFLEKRFACAPRRVQDGMKYFTDPMARLKLPDPTLRAALAALTGTVGEPAIDFLLYRAPVNLVTFSMYVSDGLPLHAAGVTRPTDGTQTIVFDRRIRFAPFSAYSALLLHEVLHTGADDDTAGLAEEAVASAVQALVYMETLLVDPSIAYLPDEFTRDVNNHQAVVRLNSGPAGSDRLTVFVPDSDVNIDPLAVEPLTEFYEYYPRYSIDGAEFRERETEGNQLLRDILTLLAEPGHSPPDDADFDQETVAFVDRNQAVLSPAELIAVACILKLDIPCA